VRIARLVGDRTWLPFAHHNCRCNQLIALRNRVLGEVPRPTHEGLVLLRDQAKRIRRLLPKVGPIDLHEVALHYGGGKRARYERAAADVLANGLTPRDARITCFVKFEKLNSESKTNPDPRAIQFRDPRYGVSLARFLKPMEPHLYQLCGDGRTLPSTRVIGKGLSQVERAMLLRAKMASFASPVVVSLDASRFDQHVDIHLLRIEHSFYRHMASNAPELSRLLSWQLYNRGSTHSGVQYRTRGKRMSGDMNTALGNCILMVLMVSTFMRGHRYDILDDGDDCLLICESGLLPWVLENVQDTFLQFGMEIKVEKVAHTRRGGVVSVAPRCVRAGAL
jgi:hypothetical protein